MMPEGKTLYADVIVNIASASLDRPFQYRIPADLKGVLQPGDPVEIPFDEDLYYEELKKRIAVSRLKENVTPTVVADLSDTYNTK